LKEFEKISEEHNKNIKALMKIEKENENLIWQLTVDDLKNKVDKTKNILLEKTEIVKEKINPQKWIEKLPKKKDR
jgi:hypothetical protein